MTPNHEPTFNQKIEYLSKICEFSSDEYTEYLNALIQLYWKTRNIDSDDFVSILIKQILEEYDYCSNHATIIDKEVTKKYIDTIVEWDDQ
jgi:hypothetical protein